VVQAQFSPFAHGLCRILGRDVVQQGEKGFITPNKQKALYWLNLSCTEGFDTGCEEFDALSGSKVPVALRLPAYP
jgi:TPR repeat protein